MAPRKGKWPPASAKAAWSRPAPARSRFGDFTSTAPPIKTDPNGFSMKDEARNTASHQASLAWVSGDTKLRQKPVAFVSAGFIEPLKELDLEPPAPTNPSMGPESTDDAAEAICDKAEVGAAEAPCLETVNVGATIAIVDQESPVAKEALLNQVVDDNDQSGEASCPETKDLFFLDLEGDDTIKVSSLPPPKIASPRSSLSGSDSSEEIILFKGRSANARGTAARKDEFILASAPTEPSGKAFEPRPQASSASSSTSTSRKAAPRAGSLRKRSRSRRRPSKSVEDNDEDEILADYIANMAADSEDAFVARQLDSLLGYRDLGGDDDAFNLGLDDDKKLLADEGRAESSGSGISDAEEDDVSDGDEGHEMDMDDETLARLLAKQEELALGGDELLIFSSSIAKTETKNEPAKHPTMTGSSTRARKGPACTTQVVDAFDNLDLVDWAQPAGQSRKRRSKQPPNFNVSDSEIEAALKTAWQRDRERKKNRKLEREALRAEGLLGKNVDQNDLRVKYPSGMKLEDMKAELVSFLLGSTDRLDFPPLDNHARKTLHELAYKFNIKSQSIGKGDQRRPVLYRTNRTVRYASARVEDATSHVERAAMRIHRKYFHRVDINVKGTGSPRNGFGGSRSDHKGLTLREGEIVGASVPELGQENKGRAMLEKMGWSKGMALGTMDNKGILEPVAQVVKRSKAGLG